MGPRGVSIRGGVSWCLRASNLFIPNKLGVGFGHESLEVAHPGPERGPMTTTRLLSREAILSAPDIATEDVDVPEWGGTVRVRTMTAGERDAWEIAQRQRLEDGTGNEDIRARWVAACMVDDNGAAVFTQDDVAALSNRSAAAMDRVFTVALRLSGIGPGAVEDAAKNSDSTPSDDSFSD